MSSAENKNRNKSKKTSEKSAGTEVKKRTRKRPMKRRIKASLSRYPIDTANESYARKYHAVLSPPAEVEALERMGDEMVAWSQQEDVFAIEDFPLSKYISPREFFKKADESNYFARCLDVARQRIGVRLIEGALTGKWSHTFIAKILPLYNPAFRQFQAEQRSQAIEKIAERSMEVVMEQYPNSPAVPYKRGDDGQENGN